MYSVILSARVRRALKKLRRSGSFDEEEYRVAVQCLIDGIALPNRFDDHQLQGGMQHLREFHLAFDLLLLYEKDEGVRVVTIVDIGNHDELFK